MGNIIEKAFLTEIQVSNRQKVRSSPARTPEPLDTIIGYEFEKSGHYRTYYFYNLPSVIQFIKSSQKDKLLCNSDDYAVACTIGDYIDICISDEYQEMLTKTNIYD